MTTTVKLEDADAKDLRKAADLLGLETKAAMNRTQLIALLTRANPDLKEITVEAPAQPSVLSQPSAAAPIIPPAPAPIVERGNAGGAAMPHYSLDPKVELTIHKTSETYRSKDVSVATNGDVFRMQRGQRVSVPYRVYLTLRDAKEMQAVETGEERMGIPVREWQEVYSYPFDVHKMPTDEEIADFHARTDNATASLSRTRAA
jgi:hypothetical protein